MRQHTRLPRSHDGQVVFITLMDQKGWWWWCQADLAYVRRAVCSNDGGRWNQNNLEIDLFPCSLPSGGCGWEHDKGIDKHWPNWSP